MANGAGRKIKYFFGSFQVLWEAQGRICPYCRQLIDPSLTSENVNVDHVVSRSKGGGNYLNLLLVHPECNAAKSNDTPHETVLQFLKDTYDHLLTDPGIKERIDRSLAAYNKYAQKKKTEKDNKKRAKDEYLSFRWHLTSFGKYNKKFHFIKPTSFNSAPSIGCPFVDIRINGWDSLYEHGQYIQGPTPWFQFDLHSKVNNQKPKTIRERLSKMVERCVRSFWFSRARV